MEKKPVVIVFIQTQIQLLLKPDPKEVELSGVEGSDCDILYFLTGFVFHYKSVFLLVRV